MLNKQHGDEAMQIEPLCHSGSELITGEYLPQVILQVLPAHIAAIDPNGRIYLVNKAWIEFANHNNLGSDGLGMNYLDVCRKAASENDADAERAFAGIRSVLSGSHKQFTMEYPCHSPLRQFWFLMTAVPFEFGGDNGVVVAHYDITERKLSGDALKNSEERYRHLFEVELDAVIVCDCETRQFIDVNPAALALYGYTREEFIQLKADDISTDPEIFRLSLQNRETAIPYRLSRRKDGSTFPIDISIRYYEYQDRTVFVATLRDITDRVLAENRMIDLNQKLSSLNEHLHASVEHERLAISRDIHDDLGQNLTILKLDLDWLKRETSSEYRETHERLNEMRSCVDQMSDKIQRIAANLRPPLLDDAGLVAAIEWQVDEFKKYSGMKCFSMLNENFDLLDMKTSIVLVRIIQEGLTNIIRHSKASEVSISLCKSDEGLLLEISDNGSGITPEQIVSPRAYGLMGMKERARNCHGELTIIGNPDCGTTLTLYIPLALEG